jgi:RimJ/RimL family protein N-acetyltransferase
MQTTFETPRLLIRPRTLADTDDCLAMDREPGVTRFIDGPWSDATAHRAFIEARTRGPYAAGFGYWSICSRADAKRSFLGWVLLIPADALGPEIEIGWRLRRDAWRQGLASEAANPLLRHAFVTLNLPKVIADIDPDNAGSIRVAEKIGLKRREAVFHHGKAVLRYALDHDDFGLNQSIQSHV